MGKRGGVLIEGWWKETIKGVDRWDGSLEGVDTLFTRGLRATWDNFRRCNDRQKFAAQSRS